MSRPVLRHPGTVVYVDGASGDVVREIDVLDVPEALRFADTPRGRVPVVRVVATVAGERRFIREYGPDGELLRSTTQLREGETP